MMNLLYQEMKGTQPLSVIKHFIDETEIYDCLVDEQIQIAKPSDFFFYQNFATLLSICYNGTLGDKNIYSSALTILLDYIALNPSKLNQKIIQSCLTCMMLEEDDPLPAICQLFLNQDDVEEPRINFFETFASYSGKDLPEYFENLNYLKTIYRKD